MDFINSKQATNTKVYDQGLREHILKVYKLMCLGIGLTGFISYFTANTPALLGLLYSNTGVTPFGWLVTFAPLILCFVFSAKINTMSSASAQMLFWVFAATMGLSLTYISLVYTGTSIFRVFLVTSSLFGVMSIYGHTTKKDLTNIGSFLFMGLIGMVIAAVVNIFLASSALQFAISVIGVLVFTGLTAYDTQKIKDVYLYNAGNNEAVAKSAIIGALTLYLDFINLFTSLLHLMGDRK